VPKALKLIDGTLGPGAKVDEFTMRFPVESSIWHLQTKIPAEHTAIALQESPVERSEGA
jgi:hypothetical protein